MDKEISIEEQSPVQDTSEETAQLPLNFLLVGTIEKDDVKIYIHQSVVSALEEYASSDTKNELGSILLGAYSTALGQTAVMISEYIEAKYTDASASTLTFTHETWDYVHKEQAEKYPEQRIVGWQHTHPGYGIFLSNYDMFIQENFFNLPFQIAYVIDPVQNFRGFFCWKNGHVEKLRGYYIYDEPGEIIAPPTEGKINPNNEKPCSLGNQMGQKMNLLGIIITLVAVCALLIAAVVWLGFRLSESNAQIQELSSRQHSMQEQIQNNSLYQNAFNEDVSERINAIGENVSDNKEQISAAQDQIDAIETEVSDASAFISAMQDQNEKPGESVEKREVVFIKISVQEDDTLQSICDNYGLNYAESVKMILGINGLEDESEIVARRAILIPVG